MAKTVLLAEGKRSGGLVQEFALPNSGKPMMIKLALTPPDLLSKAGTEITIIVFKSFNDGITFHHAHEFLARGSADLTTKDGTNRPSVTFYWDGKPMRVRVQSDAPVEFDWGLTYEDIDIVVFLDLQARGLA